MISHNSQGAWQAIVQGGEVVQMVSPPSENLGRSEGMTPVMNNCVKISLTCIYDSDFTRNRWLNLKVVGQDSGFFQI